jgi:predicted transcriptional regulator
MAKTPIGEISDLILDKHSSKVTELYNNNVLVKDIGERLGISKSAVSRILYVLKDKGKINDRGQKGVKNIINAAYAKIKKREGRNPFITEIKNETGLFESVINKNLDKPLTSGRSVSPLKGAGAKATQEMYKNRKVDKPRPQKIAGQGDSVNWPSSDSKKNYVKQLEEIYKNPKAKRTNEVLAKTFGITKNDVERINKVLIKERNLKYPEADTSKVSKQRYSDLKLSQGYPGISAPAGTKHQFHHMIPYAGYAKIKTGDVMVLDKYLNSKIGPENLELNRIAKEIVGLDLNGDPSALKKLDALNAESEKYFNKAKDRLPKNLKGAMGYVKYNPIFDENGQVFDLGQERIGVDSKLSLQKFSNNVSKNIKDFNIDELKDFKKNVSSEAVSKFIKKVKSVPGGCRAVITRALGGPLDTCEAIIKADPEKAAAKLTNAITATKGPLKDLKQDSQKLIRLFRGESFPQRNMKSMKDSAKFFNTTLDEIKRDKLSGQWFSPDQIHADGYNARPGQLKYVDVTPTELESFNRYKTRVNKLDNKYSTKKRLNLPDAPKKNVTDSFHHQIIPRYKLKQMEDAGRMKTKYTLNPFKKQIVSADPSNLTIQRTPGVLEYDNVIGGFVDPKYPTQVVDNAQIKTWAAENPMPVRAGTEDALKPIKGNLLKTVGKSLAYVGAPLPTALIDSYFVGRQISEDKSAAEIAKDPLNWLGLATMSSLSNISGVTKPGKVNAALRLGMSPGLIRGVSRFAGLPGLAISTALTAYDQYEKYKNEEGLIYNFFNKDSKAI